MTQFVAENKSVTAGASDSHEDIDVSAILPPRDILYSRLSCCMRGCREQTHEFPTATRTTCGLAHCPRGRMDSYGYNTTLVYRAVRTIHRRDRFLVPDLARVRLSPQRKSKPHSWRLQTTPTCSIAYATFQNWLQTLMYLAYGLARCGFELPFRSQVDKHNGFRHQYGVRTSPSGPIFELRIFDSRFARNLNIRTRCYKQHCRSVFTSTWSAGSR